MTRMQSAIFSRFGNPAEVLTVSEIDQPKPNQGEVLIQMIMSPIHNHDLLTISGDYGYKPQLPAIGGSEAVGRVVALGEGVCGVRVGDRVATAGAHATWAQFFTADTANIVKVPDGLSDELAAQAMGMPTGTVMALNSFDAKPGDWVVANAGNGAVGKIFAAVAKARGLNVALLVRSAASVAQLNRLGVQHAFATRDSRWKNIVKATIGNGRVVGAIDMIGGSAAGDLAGLLTENGLLLSFGAMSNEPLEIEASDLIFKQLRVRGFWSAKVGQSLKPEQFSAIVTELFTLLGDGRLKLPVEKIVPLAQSNEAVAAAALQSREGKVLIAA